ncbi:hypothetical protein [Desulfurivibrio dismutans]|uniref:hypothetical protein n=1 Tax=Desulfurivibrio dismutans TaxID=1398908 RepID=UPI0023DB2AD5|nr:hypothetical protein [Desulfurivibrio alkaliphilus]MDF1615133.1 hypothetical protein [Desulfurivibrio alkaliphilus]
MESKSNQVVVVDIGMPFWSMVIFMVKWSIAAIPAMIIIFVIVSLFFAVMGGVFGGFGGHMGGGRWG